MPAETKIGRTLLRLVTGDIADQDTDAVVTAAHWRLNKGNRTDVTIHTEGGPKIYEECLKIGSCPIGDAVIMTDGNLKARFVIHAVGPVWRTLNPSKRGFQNQNLNQTVFGYISLYANDLIPGMRFGKTVRI